MPRDMLPPRRSPPAASSSSSSEPKDGQAQLHSSPETSSPSISLVASPEDTTAIPTPSPSHTTNDPSLADLERSGPRATSANPGDASMRSEDAEDKISAAPGASTSSFIHGDPEDNDEDYEDEEDEEEPDHPERGPFAWTPSPRPAQQSARFLRDARSRLGGGFGFGGRAAEPVRSKRDELHPYVSALSARDLESCLRLEEQVFGEAEREEMEKFHYRLSACPELSLGLFASNGGGTAKNLATVPTFASALPADSAQPGRKAVLLGMIIALKTDSPVITDKAIEVPPNWRTLPPSETEERGYIEHGRTITLLSLGILSGFQHCGLGQTLLRSYQQRMSTSGIADRIALIARENLVGWYESMGFKNKGKSTVKFAGGEWWDLVYEFSDVAMASFG